MTAATGALHITPSEEAEKKENLELTPQQAVYAGSESEVEQLKQEMRRSTKGHSSRERINMPSSARIPS